MLQNSQIYVLEKGKKVQKMGIAKKELKYKKQQNHLLKIDLVAFFTILIKLKKTIFLFWIKNYPCKAIL